jgi:hypothetical protein
MYRIEIKFAEIRRENGSKKNLKRWKNIKCLMKLENFKNK